MRALNDASAIDSVQVAADACVALVVPEIYAFVEVLTAGLLSVVPCSNEHIWRNWGVKTVSSETRASDKFNVFENSVSSFPDKKVICGIDAYKQRM